MNGHGWQLDHWFGRSFEGYLSKFLAKNPISIYSIYFYPFLALKMAPDSTFILYLLIIFGKKVCFCRQGTRTCVAGWNGECTTLQWSLCASTVLLRFHEMFRAKQTLVHMLWTLVWHLDPTHLKWKHPYDLAWSCTWPLCVTYDNMIPPASSKLFGQGSCCGHYLFKPYSARDHRSLQAKTVTLGSTRNSLWHCI